MKDEEINRRLEQQDKDQRLYTDMKIRAIKKLLAPFIWMRNNPGKAIAVLVILFVVTSFLLHIIDIKETIEKMFNIEFKR